MGSSILPGILQTYRLGLSCVRSTPETQTNTFRVVTSAVHTSLYFDPLTVCVVNGILTAGSIYCLFGAERGETGGASSLFGNGVRDQYGNE